MSAKPKLVRTQVTRSVAVPSGTLPSLAPAPRADGARLANRRVECVLQLADGPERVVRARDLPLDGSRGFVSGAFLPDGRIAVTAGDVLEIVDDEGRTVSRARLPAGLAGWGLHPVLDGQALVVRGTGRLAFFAPLGSELVSLGAISMPREGNFTIAGGAVFYNRDISVGGDLWWRVDGVDALLDWAVAKRRA